VIADGRDVLEPQSTLIPRHAWTTNLLMLQYADVQRAPLRSRLDDVSPPPAAQRLEDAMKYLFARGSEAVLERFCWSRIVLAFDFDGTLAPIVARPDDASMRANTRARLAALADRYPCAIISGRSRADVRGRVAGIRLAAVIGNHGVEPAEGMATHAEVVARWRPVLEAQLGSVPGVEVESKGYSVAIHYRRSRAKRAAKAAIHAAIEMLHGAPRVIGGEQVLNIIPAGAPHKGIALQRLRAELGVDTALYVGDDVTDEDVFALDEPGRLLSVRIGRSTVSAAPYYLRDQFEIDGLLDRLLELRADPASLRQEDP
jgi:trehalose 6-phosphate phosphatase